MSTPPPLRIGLIGLGAVAEQHFAACRSLPGIEIVAGADPCADRRDAFASRGRLVCHDDHRHLLECERLDVALVLTPPATHATVVRDCADAGVHVLCEKPLALDTATAEAMVAHCRQRGVQLFYGSSYRYLPAVQAAYRIIAEGGIGDVVMMREAVIGGCGRAQQPVMGPHHCPAGGPGGSLMGLVDHGIHLIDVLPWIAGSRVRRVVGRGNISGQPLRSEFALLELDNGALCHLLYDDGTFGTTLPGEGAFSWGSAWSVDGLEPAGSWHRDPGCIHVHGTKGALRILHYANVLIRFAHAGVQQVALPGRPAPGHFASQLEAVAEDLGSDGTPRVAGEAGVEAVRVLGAVYESARQGCMVEVTRP
jgi:predicted dehydrogenase